ncbi:methylenetetrahydrofolate reductase [NAD(P)H] [Lepagella muris]|jgi:methylenetetrahydrofolate reductase (NADPH)|uniref:Methylenetetrahydrofolate reductase [NAD(P)H] n=1 Tax=Lepagella muris TaxID=3032870 RepID=A0AC61RDH5_9BACT|nr:methylenetetrahydrofolate reductase [NAD(P)H] [Lepagella muris]ROT09184.1 methylenetetrahydrofolate reductase [NAD(P)H] [Muribaculaceae bacterium Isolate-037 (Harlan)]TGY76665.1 methylenetetrahydrofolate reductase [NAD(P)H] [Lepagella muris]THG48215.1 methylenetetrahydrofolate reductase [NAD(P)H] [Bacteroidales bacterium]TKC54363.1 methylenetetrahydrofolate reductase [NAD(P)H] [Bacteroidales bacterium]
MRIIDIINDSPNPVFSFEILPPLKGNSIYKVFDIVEKLKRFDPKFVNITSHHSEYIYKPLPDGTHRRVSIVKRPGTVAIAAAIQNRYGLIPVPHIICKGFTKEETEYALLDLNFLGINNLLVLRGDEKGQDSTMGQPNISHEHATDLQKQINLFNEGIGLEDMRIQGIETPFSYGMACYPEKHEEAPNMESDIYYMKKKMENGADYFVTQMFFDNEKYFSFVERCRAAGINVPIIPGLKPISKMSHLTMLPKVFRIDIPEELASRIRECKTDTEVKQVGIEWGIRQSRELLEKGALGLHYYTMSVSDSVSKIVENVY